MLLAATIATLVVTSGVALAVTKIGGPGSDVLRGTNAPDTLDGKGGSDTLVGFAARDCLGGGDGPDAVEGGPGNDIAIGGPAPLGANCNPPLEQERPGASDSVSGGPGDDIVDGAAGADSLFGGDGDDIVADGENRGGAKDALSGGAGDDIMFPRNVPAGTDVVTCGSGRDTVFADRADVISGDCERVFFRNPRPSDF